MPCNLPPPTIAANPPTLMAEGVERDTGPDFTKPWAHSDIVFVTEGGGQIHANKTVLSMWSPVLEAMFTADFREKDAAEIQLPGKTHEDVLELMRVVHPPNKEVNSTNVCQLLPLTQEYQMSHVIARCERHLLAQPPSIKSLVLAERYDLPHLRRACVQYAKHASLTQLKRHGDFEKIDPNTLVEVLTHKVERLESPMLAIRALVGQKNPNLSRWCPASDSRDVQDRHDLGSRKGCLHCNSYNFEQIEKVCSSHQNMH